MWSEFLHKPRDLMAAGNGQIHNWAQGGIPINSQSPLVRQDIYEQLGLVAAPAETV